MCLIVDANLASVVFGAPSASEFVPVIDWLTSANCDGKLIVGGHLLVELDRVDAARRFVKTLLQAGRALRIPQNVIDLETLKVRNRCISDDEHVLALARLSGARLLCSNDRSLHQDFTNPVLINKPRGHIYQDASHAHLLRRYGHTAACRKLRHV